MVELDTKLLMICPTRSRPVRVLEMKKAFYETKSEGTEICFVLSFDDPCLDEYMKALEGEDVHVIPERYIPIKTNYAATKLYPNLPYYGAIDDDQIPRTKGWDARLIEAIEKHGGWGLACGEDMLTSNWYMHRHPATYILNGGFVREFGYMVNPIFTHTGIDGWFSALFWGINRLYYLHDVIIEHMHATANKAPMDEQYKWIYGSEMNHGMEVLENWKRTAMTKDISKLLNAIERSKNARVSKA